MVSDFAREMTLNEARRGFFEAEGFPDDGGYEDKFVFVKVGPVVLPLPNVAARRRVVQYHDFHHILTRYGTDLAGEAELAAWETGAGVPPLWEPWLVNLSAIAMGILSVPRRTFRAFVRGRQGRTLYRQPIDDLLCCDIGSLRKRIGLIHTPESATRGDVGLFLIVASTAVTLTIMLLVVFLLYVTVLGIYYALRCWGQRRSVSGF
jgi:hypothetical protein